MSEAPATLIEEYRQLVGTIRVGRRAVAIATWHLADWLLEHVPPDPVGRPPKNANTYSHFSLEQLAAEGEVTVRYLQFVRLAAVHFPPDIRVVEVSAQIHERALEVSGDRDRALAGLRAGKVHLRDWQPTVDLSTAARALEDDEARPRVLERLSQKTRTAVVEDVVEESPSVVVQAIEQMETTTRDAVWQEVIDEAPPRVIRKAVARQEQELLDQLEHNRQLNPIPAPSIPDLGLRMLDAMNAAWAVQEFFTQHALPEGHHPESVLAWCRNMRRLIDDVETRMRGEQPDPALIDVIQQWLEENRDAATR